MEMKQREREGIVLVHKTSRERNREVLCSDIQSRSVLPEHHNVTKEHLRTRTAAEELENQ